MTHDKILYKYNIFLYVEWIPVFIYLTIRLEIIYRKLLEIFNITCKYYLRVLIK